MLDVCGTSILRSFPFKGSGLDVMQTRVIDKNLRPQEKSILPPVERISLFPHNQKAYTAALSLMEQSGKAAVIHPTGTGKSFIGFKLAEAHPASQICWLSPSEYIFKTQIENLKAVTGGYAPDNITFLTYAKLMLMPEASIKELSADFIILDEFHRCGAAEWGKGVQAMLAAHSSAQVLGLSATAIRYLDNKRNMADELFDGSIASEMTLGEAIVRNILLAPFYVISIYSYKKELEAYEKRVRSLKNSVASKNGEQYLEALRRALEKAEGLDAIFNRHMADRTGKYIVFCANVEHMREMMSHLEWFQLVDKTPHVYSVVTANAASSKNFTAFKSDVSNHLKLLFCVDMLNEGVHVEDVSGVILFRPTASPIIYKQQIGRALCASKSRKPVIFDIVNNFDGLASIDSIQAEMDSAVGYYRQHNDKKLIINEHFKIIDEVHDCRQLFEQLRDTISASWERYFSAAQRYWNEHGHLAVPARHKTEDGLSLGSWIITQRRVRAGMIAGTLPDQAITRLNSIGMIWENPCETRWEHMFQAAETYFKQYGNLDVPGSYRSQNGLALGHWLIKLRQQKISGSTRLLNNDRIQRLNAIGMIWDRTSYLWERNYLSAVAYSYKYGNLDVPVSFVADTGIRLGMWINRLRRIRAGKVAGELTAAQISRLDALGMLWEDKYENAWSRAYAAAKKYYEKHGNLNVPIAYRSPDGIRVGEWIRSQRDARKSDSKRFIDARRIAMLDAIGMVWSSGDAWEKRYQLAKHFFEEHGNLDISMSAVFEGNIWLGKWVYDQRKLQNCPNADKKLPSDKVERLNAIGMIWDSKQNHQWMQSYNAAKEFYAAFGHLNVPYSYKSTTGLHLRAWLNRQRNIRRNAVKSCSMTEERIALLDALGMEWGKLK